MGEAASHAAGTYRARRSFHLPQRHPVRIGPGTMRSPVHGMAEARVSHRRLPASRQVRCGSALLRPRYGSHEHWSIAVEWSATPSPCAARRPNTWMSAGHSSRSAHDLHRSGGSRVEPRSRSNVGARGLQRFSPPLPAHDPRLAGSADPSTAFALPRVPCRSALHRQAGRRTRPRHSRAQLVRWRTCVGWCDH